MERSAANLGAMEAGPPALDRPRRRWRLPRWLGIVFPALVAVGAGFAVVFFADRSALPLAVMMATPVGVGVAAGAVVRWSMPGRSTVLRWVVAMAAVTIGLLTVGLLTGGAAGVLPGGSDGGVQWVEVGELALAGLMAALALAGWRRPASSVEEPSAPFVAVPVVATPPTPARPSASDASPWWRRTWNAFQGRLRSEPSPRLIQAVPPRPSGKRRSRSDIRLTGAEEYRCPYCLTPVREADPRGVVVCPICHTPHHADCWAVTGTCQVPHAYGTPS